MRRYFTGRPCKRGHIAKWQTRPNALSGQCLECKKISAHKTFVKLTDAQRANRNKRKRERHASQTPEQKAARHMRERYLRERQTLTQKTKRRQRERKRLGLPEPTRPMPLFCEASGMPPGKQSLHLDHDHISGAFRGWLSAPCNLALGLLIKIGNIASDERKSAMQGMRVLTAYLDHHTLQVRP